MKKIKVGMGFGTCHCGTRMAVKEINTIDNEVLLVCKLCSFIISIPLELDLKGTGFEWKNVFQ